MRRTACAVKTALPGMLATAGKVDDGTSTGGAARSAKARVNPSLEEAVLKR
jgi:hypothetical protein